MAISEKVQMEGVELEGKKWVIDGVSFRTPLKPINTNPLEKIIEQGEEDCSTKAAENEEEGCSTPTAKEARIPEKLLCPPAPRKRKSSSRCNFTGVREFFTPPDLDSVFIRRVERAK
ncbi:cyclin-dependent protein kinase inhibitor SMR6-like [Magnolia sinica]|uniref:cyclin-dependent protein kinase inhibitor SMR6-like n=1 Tax=Magnolia sinica TaxID=86752 RepID=UPI0026599D57|nr:cyclin-dependent protein kinase inhibitor SMR6-like [Magnolia sinica]